MMIAIIADPENLLIGTNLEFAFNFDAALHSVIQLVGVELVLVELIEIALLRLGGDGAIEMAARAVHN